MDVISLNSRQVCASLSRLDVWPSCTIQSSEKYTKVYKLKSDHSLCSVIEPGGWCWSICSAFHWLKTYPHQVSVLTFCHETCKNRTTTKENWQRCFFVFRIRCSYVLYGRLMKGKWKWWKDFGSCPDQEVIDGSVLSVVHTSHVRGCWLG